MLYPRLWSLAECSELAAQRVAPCYSGAVRCMHVRFHIFEELLPFQLRAVEDALRAALSHDRREEVYVKVVAILFLQLERHAVRVDALHRAGALQIRDERRARRRPVSSTAVRARVPSRGVAERTAWKEARVWCCDVVWILAR